jgi:hypothetical protein
MPAPHFSRDVHFHQKLDQTHDLLSILHQKSQHLAPTGRVLLLRNGTLEVVTIQKLPAEA